MSPIEKLFMDAGFSYAKYQFWRLCSLPGLKKMAAIERLQRGWPIESFDDEASELRLAKMWLENNAPRAAADQERKAVQSSPAADAPYGPLLTTSEAQKLLEEERASGRHTSLKAFEQALRRAAKKARACPDLLPLSLGGQHADWQLVELASESGGHGNGHRLRRRQALHQG